MLTFIDFSADLPASDAKPKPGVRTGKFIHAKNENIGKEYVVFSPLKLDFYHAHIVSRFSQHTGIAGSWVPPNRQSMFIVDDPQWVIRGGHMRIDDVEKRISLGGVSMAYGAPVCSFRKLEAMLLGLPEFAGYSGSKGSRGRQ